MFAIVAMHWKQIQVVAYSRYQSQLLNRKHYYDFLTLFYFVIHTFSYLFLSLYFVALI